MRESVGVTEVSENNNYEKIEKIGHGAFGEAFTVLRRQDKKIFVMKTEKVEAQMRRKRQDEVKALKKCQHPNIVSYEDSFFEDGYSHIIMEYCKEGDLATFFKKDGKVQIAMACSFILNLAHGMEYLQKKRIVHRDLKPENIFICYQYSYVLKIGGFGFARCMER